MSKIIFNDDKIDLMKQLLNEDISIGSIGLMLYFIKHENEDVQILKISDDVKECASSVGKYMNELKNEGYLNIRRNITKANGKIDIIYYIQDINRHLRKKNNSYNYKHKYCLNKSMELLNLENISLSHLGAWYIIEYTNYKKGSFPTEEIVSKLKLKSKNVFKYISSYNKIKNEHFENTQQNQIIALSY